MKNLEQLIHLSLGIFEIRIQIQIWEEFLIFNYLNLLKKSLFYTFINYAFFI